jgi:hypothetical protein
VTLDGAVKRLTNDGYDHNSPAWSPDGKSLVARRELGLSGVIASKQMHGAPTDLALFAADGGAPKNLTADWDLLPGPPAFSPDGRFVYFAAGVGGSDHLFRVAANSPRVEQVTTGERHLANFTPSARWDAMAYIAGDSAHPEELFVAGIDGRGEKKLTTFNDAFVKDIEAIAADRILYPSKDGTRIEGWVLKPRGYDPARAWPLILAMHGGPHGAYGNDFSFEFQLFAANGYLVVYTNPRGSTNYGEKFLWGTVGRLGEPRLRGRHGRRRLREDEVHRRRAAHGRHRLLVRRLPDQLGDRPHDAVRGGDLGCGDFELDQRLRHGRHPADEGERVHGSALGPQGARDPAQAVTDRVRREHQDTDDVPRRRIGPSRADRRGGADVYRPPEAARPGADGALSGFVPRRLESVEHGPSLSRRAEVVASVSGFASDHYKHRSSAGVGAGGWGLSPVPTPVDS